MFLSEPTVWALFLKEYYSWTRWQEEKKFKKSIDKDVIKSLTYLVLQFDPSMICEFVLKWKETRGRQMETATLRDGFAEK